MPMYFPAGKWICAAGALLISVVAIHAQRPELVLPALDLEKRTKGPEELALEQAINETYKSCFRDFEVGGKSFRLRIPFGENGERFEAGIFEQQIAFGGMLSPR